MEDIEKWFQQSAFILLSPNEPEKTKSTISMMKTNSNFDYQSTNESNNVDRLKGKMNEFLCKFESDNSMMYCKLSLSKNKSIVMSNKRA